MFSLNRDKNEMNEGFIDNPTNEINKENNTIKKNIMNDSNQTKPKETSWSEDFSWSRILMSDSEALRQTGSVYRQKDTNMVSLVRRLELFPSLDLIVSTRKLFDDEIDRLNKVKEVVEFESNQLKDSNPILTQASMEVESELSKIQIEKDSFEKKLSSEVQIIDDLVQTIISHEAKSPELISSLLRIYNFELDKSNKVKHLSHGKKIEKNVNQFGSLKPADTLSKNQDKNKVSK